LSERIATVLDPDGEHVQTPASTAAVKPQAAETEKTDELVAAAEPTATPETSSTEETQPASNRLTLAMITGRQVDPMIGMAGVTPQQFMAKP